MIRLTGLALGLALSLVACGPADAEQQLEEQRSRRERPSGRWRSGGRWPSRGRTKRGLG